MWTVFFPSLINNMCCCGVCRIPITHVNLLCVILFSSSSSLSLVSVCVRMCVCFKLNGKSNCQISYFISKWCYPMQTCQVSWLSHWHSYTKSQTTRMRLCMYACVEEYIGNAFELSHFCAKCRTANSEEEEKNSIGLLNQILTIKTTSKLKWNHFLKIKCGKNNKFMHKFMWKLWAICLFYS